ncbi:MAG: DUF3810 domain-containing protein [Clostridia bacterium]|nr:DUF3810 domain-containing protein [Clostridia bacterium]
MNQPNMIPDCTAPSGMFSRQSAPRRRLPLAVWVIYGLALLSGIIHLIAVFVPRFADWFNTHVGAGLRAALAFLSGWFPFSFGEMLLLSLPVIFVLLLRVALVRYGDSWRSVLRYCAILLAVLLCFYILFVWGFGTGYHGSTIEEKLELDRQPVSAEELEMTARYLVDRIHLELDALTYRPDGFSVMPYSHSRMNEKLLDAYVPICERYDFVQPLRSKIKQVMLSEPMTYTHISGVYSYFTGEANLNMNFPDYTLPFTAAHELAHQRGIAREDEANFMAFLVCTASDDAYIRYSGYLNLYEYVASALYSANPDRYFSVLRTLDAQVRGELSAYSDFFDRYRETVVSEVSGTINDTYLKLQGTEGSKSYGRVVDLAVAYYKTLPLE